MKTRVSQALVLWAPLAIGALLAVLLVQWAHTRLRTKLDEAAFGRDTQNVLVKVDGLQVSCMYPADSVDCLQSYQQAGRPPSILWLGNSQLAAINRYKEGDRTASVILHERLRPRGYYVVTYSEPNANLFEHAVVYAALQPHYKPALVILPVFLDKIREQGVRLQIAGFLDDSAANASIAGSPIWSIVAPLIAAARHVSAAKDGGPFYARFEARVNSVLANAWPVWGDRPVIQGFAKIGMFRLRNLVLHIDAQTKRKVDPNAYREKMEVLEAMLDDARARGVRMLLYIPPYRQDIEGPNVVSEYKQLKVDVERLAARYGALFADVDNVVPGPEWATVVDEVFGIEDFDFVHFTAQGHRRHADALDEILQKIGL